MDTIGLTLRSKSRRARPQISNPKPISGPLPAHGKGAVKPGASARLQKDRSAYNAATSDLVKRRYSSRFNQPEIDSAAPPVPELPPIRREYGGGLVPRIPPSSDPTQPIPVDLNALGDPSLPVDRCSLSSPIRKKSSLLSSICSNVLEMHRCGQVVGECVRERHRAISKEPAKDEEPNF